MSWISILTRARRAVGLRAAGKEAVGRLGGVLGAGLIGWHEGDDAACTKGCRARAGRHACRMGVYFAFLWVVHVPMADAFGAETFYLAGGTGDGAARTILRGGLDESTGQLNEIVAIADGVDPAFFAISAEGKFFHAVRPDGTVVALAMQPDGMLKVLNARSDAGKGSCHVALGGGHLFTANYTSGDMAVFPVGPDGALGGRSALVLVSGSGPDPRRQTKPHPHSASLSHDGKFVYLCDLGTDNVWIFRLDPKTGTVAPADPPSGRVPAGAGPRHLAWGAGQTFAYVCNEMGLTVTVFQRNAETGALTPMQTLSALPDGQAASERATAAEIIRHPSGKFLYVSIRGMDLLSLFSVGADGRLSLLETVPAGVKTPRSFDVSPSGRWLVVAGQDDHRVALFAIDPTTGKLTPSGRPVHAQRPECVRFLDTK